MNKQTSQTITLENPLRFRSAFSYPLQSKMSRSEVLRGGLLLLIPFVGWVFNMGHRIEMTHRMQHGLPAWPAWRNYRVVFRDGIYTLLGMIEYHAPAVLVGAVAWYLQIPALYVVAGSLWILATLAVPGYMSHYCYQRDPSEIFNPAKAMRRVLQTGKGYWHAWLIALSALGLSFLGLLLFGVGFLFTSVWFWQVAGFLFATQFTQVHKLHTES